MLIQSQASDVNIIVDDGPCNLTCTVCNLEELPRVLETRRRVGTKKDMITLDNERRQKKTSLNETILTQPPPTSD